MCVFKNEQNEDEIGFKTLAVAHKVLEVSKSIDMYCHTRENNYLMQLLANITKLAIERKYITYDELFVCNEDDMFRIFKEANDVDLIRFINEFENVKKDEIPEIKLPKVKIRSLNPLVNGKRML